jgi:UDP-2,4-diacetamido-2,4,6-trideoxy-beta-L-altropyranose hydrolase
VKVAIRTDASSFIGTGHVVRCKTLADALRDGGAEIRFVCREHPGNMIQALQSAGYNVLRLPVSSNSREALLDHGDYGAWLGVEQAVDAAQTVEALADFRTDWLVVDHYGLDSSWEQLVRPAAGHIFVIDDLANRPHNCELLLDQNFYADMESRYAGLLPSHTKQLLGPRFALLRPEYRKLRESLPQRSGVVRRILVFFGGVDRAQETEKALDALDEVVKTDVHVDVVVGDTNPHREAVRRRCTTLPNTTYYCQRSDMAMLMARADLAIGAAGVATWERCCLGLPSVVISVAENQELTARDLARGGHVLYLGRSREVTADAIRLTLKALLANPSWLEYLGCSARKITDGYGLDRVMLRLFPPALHLRPAAATDVDAIYSWRNAEETRRFAFDDRIIPRERHERWFDKTLQDPRCVLLIGEHVGKAMGVLRYDIEGDEAKVSVYLVPGLHGRGFGGVLLRAGSDWMREHYPGVLRLRAVIKPDNRASQHAFASAGYVEHAAVYIKDQQQ